VERPHREFVQRRVLVVAFAAGYLALHLGDTHGKHNKTRYSHSID